MAQKYKMTGCAKFFIFFIIAAPISYIGASYYNGVDPFAKLKEIEFLKFDKKNDSSSTKDFPSSNLDESSLKKELDVKNSEIKYLKNKIEKLEELIETQKKDIYKLKNKK